MSKATNICRDTPESIVAIESDWNYSIVITSDGEREMSGYTKKHLIGYFELNLKEINRNVSVNMEHAKIDEEKGGVEVLGNFYKVPRRKMKTFFATLVLLFAFVTSFSQNAAPIAVNDTLKVCNDVTTAFNVFRNDSDPNGDRLILAAFNNSSTIDVIAMGNTGSFRLNGNGDVGTFDFGYTVKDLRFANIGSKTATARVFISTSSPYIYLGNYTTTNIRTACRSSTSGTVTIANNARETITVDTYGELLPGTTIAPSGSGVFELKVKR